MIVLNPFGHTSEPYVEKKLAFIIFEQALVYQQHPTVQNPMRQMNNYNLSSLMQNLSCKKKIQDMTEINFDVDDVIKQ